MDPDRAVITVLRDAAEPLHWTVIQDRALRQGYLDPFVSADVRGQVLASLRSLAVEGSIERVDKGTYRLTPRSGLGDPGSPAPGAGP